MGFLKSILGKVADEVIGQIKNATSGYTPAQNTYTSTPKANAYKPDPVRQEKTFAESKAYFLDIIRREFPSYSIQENVPVTHLAGEAADEFQLYHTRPRQVYKAEWGEPYTFVLSQGGAPKGIVMLGSGHSHYSNVKYLISRMYAKKLGLPYINFYTQMPNESDYVAERIRKFLC